MEHVSLCICIGTMLTRTQDSAKISEADLRCDTDRALSGAPDIVAVPCNRLKDIWVDTGGSEECAKILVLCIVGCELDDETGDPTNIQ